MRFPNDLRPTRRHARAAARPSQRRKPEPRAGEMRTALTGWGGANQRPRAGNARTGLSRAARNAATRRAVARPSQRRKPGPRASEMRTALTGWDGANERPRAGNARTIKLGNQRVRPARGRSVGRFDDHLPFHQTRPRADEAWRRRQLVYMGNRKYTPRAWTKRVASDT